MTYPNPPAVGSTGWGTDLNGYLQDTLQAEADQNETNFANHISASPTPTNYEDPHGDRAFAQSLMAPFQANVNASSGFIQLNTSGVMPLGVWQDFRPLTTSFTYEGSPQLYPPQYQQDMAGRVWTAGYVYVNTTSYNGAQVFVNPLPASLRPNMPVNLIVSVLEAGTGSAFETAVLTIANTGYVTLNGCPAGLPLGTPIGIYGWYPLDAYYSLIQE